MTPESVGLPIRPYLLEAHRLVCGECRSKWHPVQPTDPDDPAWYGRCANCNSDNLLVESEPVYGAPITDEWHLQCAACDATWVGLPEDPCWWCQRASEIQIEHQADLLLTPPGTDPDDTTYENRMAGWADRLVVGVKAELITTEQAQAAWNRALRSRAA